MDLSIIIPVYNTIPKLLERCIDSIIKITKINYEILVINDGSSKENTQNYKKIIEKYNSKSIKYIYQSNKGVSTARNLGLEQAIGKYIMFVDSDDIIFANELSKKDFQNNDDLIIYDKKQIINEKNYENKELNHLPGKVQIEDAIKEFIYNKKIYGPWSKLFKNEFIKKWNIQFNSDIIQGEDAIFNLDVLLKKPKILYINKALYGYYYEMNNSKNRWKKFPDKMFENSYYFYLRKKQAIEELKLDNSINLQKSIVNEYIDTLFRVCMNFCSGSNRNKNILLSATDYIQKIEQEINLYPLNATYKFKYRVLKKGKYKLISSISILRKIYLKYLKKNYK